MAETGDEKMRNEWRSAFPSTIRRLREAGISVLRIWLLGNAWNYGTKTLWQPPPPPPDGDAWTNSYSLHLREVLGFCQTEGLKVIPVLLAHGAFFAGMREALALVPSIREDFFDRVLEPMLTVSDEFRRTVWAWELVNEPNWATIYPLSTLLAQTVPRLLRTSPNAHAYWPTIPVVPLARMQEFLDEGTKRILAHAHGVRIVTHGFSFGLGCRYELPWLIRVAMGPSYPTRLDVADERVFQVTAPEDAYLRQFHYYPTRISVPGDMHFDIRNDLPNHSTSQAILGEISTHLPDAALETTEVVYAAWRRLGGRDTASVSDAVYYRLVLAEQLGYDHALLWPNNEEWAGGDQPILTDDALKGVRRFLSDAKLPRI